MEYANIYNDDMTVSITEQDQLQHHVLQAVGQDLSQARQQAWQDWVEQYKEALRANGQSDEQRIQLQNRSNPCYIPRNHLLQTCIEKAEEGDFSEVNQIRRVHKCCHKACASRIPHGIAHLCSSYGRCRGVRIICGLLLNSTRRSHAYPSDTQQLMSLYSHQLHMLLQQRLFDCN